ncbi:MULTISPECIES: subclass B1 metallo-beta-lactamase [Arenibacter]|uniref:subclass B1 metallo-beta-lactamase n=1 Tax=Arenibacter TaxID=178469 RepID=UPI001C07A066|nr:MULTISPECIES: subclass B1 metallo-beta-lactamase [Arenibacter]MBU2905256.1 subclass B1 metallo-beta-lactamase [Arenibacter algicola]MCK0133065.1 subclass B1 metallo-beta-lactamase [Arenibacter sp. S6351L]
MAKYLIVVFSFAGLLLASCNETSNKQNRTDQKIVAQTAQASLADSSIVYKTDNLIVNRLSDHIYQHISFLNTNDFGRVACNGMLVVYENEALVFDTPTDDESSLELINYVTKKLNCEIKVVVPTHFHGDCVGGLEAFYKYNIPAYASNSTIELLGAKDKVFSRPMNGFVDSLALNIGGKKVYVEYFGEGHTKDNVIGYVPLDNAIFGGCLIKEVGATKGNLEDANVKTWSNTVRKIKQKYPAAKIIIPGHGIAGGTELLDYTIKLFQ